MQLGPTVLLDPALLHLTQRGYPRSSKYFDRVLAIVIRELENDAFEVEIPWLWEQRRFLLRAVDVIAGSSTFEHVRAFLDNTCFADMDYVTDSDGVDI